MYTILTLADVCTVLLMYCTVLCMSYWSTAVKAWLSRWRVCSGYCVPLLSDHLWVCAEGFRGWYAESWYYSWYFSCLFNSSSPSAHIAIHCCPVSHLCSVLVWIQMFPCILTHSHKQNILLCKCFLKPLLCHIISVQVIQKHWSLYLELQILPLQEDESKSLFHEAHCFSARFSHLLKSCIFFMILKI